MRFPVVGDARECGRVFIFTEMTCFDLSQKIAGHDSPKMNAKPNTWTFVRLTQVSLAIAPDRNT